MKRSIKCFKSVRQTLWDKHGSLRIFPLLLLWNAVLYFRLAFLNVSSLPTVWWNPLSLYQQLMKDSKFGLTFWLDLNTPHVKAHVTPSTDSYVSAAIFVANEKHIVLKCTCDPRFGRSCWNNTAHREGSIDVSKYIKYFLILLQYSALFYWGQKGELYTSY